MEALLRLVLVWVVLVAPAAWARPGPLAARVLKARQVVLREGPGESAELRVHPDYLTTLDFGVELAPGTVEVEDPERVHVLGAKGRVVVLELVRGELSEGERVRLWVTLGRGGTAVRAVLVLVPHPSEVDTQVRVELSEKLARVVGAVEPREQPDLLTLLLSGGVALGEKLTGKMLPASVSSEDVRAGFPWLYEEGAERVLAIPIHNPEGAPPWEPRVVMLASEALGPKPVALSAHMRVARLMPGESGWVLLAWPPRVNAFHLEMRERESGRGARLEWGGQ